jgi:glutamate-1-semialdehyde 2,1-aminomutase
MSLAPAKQVNFPMAVPDSAGIPNAVKDDMLIAPFNDIAFVRSLLAEQGDQVAAVIVEPLQRIIPAHEGYLVALKAECEKHGVLLIFDEIVTGFRLAYGGAQERYGVVPDICTMGKIIGGGFPLAALGARRDIMDHFDKSKVGADKWLMQLGTLSGNPIASTAGLKTMEVLRRDGAYDQLRANGARLMKMQADALNSVGINHQIVGDETLFDVLFIDQPVANYRDVQQADMMMNKRYNDVLRNEGIFKSLGKMYPHLTLSEQDFVHTENAVKKAVASLV